MTRKNNKQFRCLCESHYDYFYATTPGATVCDECKRAKDQGPREKGLHSGPFKVFEDTDKTAGAYQVGARFKTEEIRVALVLKTNAFNGVFFRLVYDASLFGIKLSRNAIVYIYNSEVYDKRLCKKIISRRDVNAPQIKSKAKARLAA